MRKNKFTFFTIFICFVFSLVAQDFKRDMLDLTRKMGKSKNLSFTIHYKMFLDNDYSSPFDERDINIIKSAPYNMYCKDDNSSEYIVNKSSFLFINHRYKQMLLKPQTGKAANNDELLNLMDTKFDTIMMIYEKVSSKKISDDLVQYECIMKAGAYTKMWILYNHKTQLTEKITYFHKRPIRKNKKDQKLHPVTIEVSYRDFDFKPSIKPEIFSEKKFIQKTGKKYLLQKSYSTYKFINLIEDRYGDSE